MSINERVWTGHLIGWIREAASNGGTIFEDATNDQGITVDNNNTRFPDVLLFLNKVSGLIFNGWELKFPDTPVDDSTMLFNALEKARYLHSNSIVTWNGSEAIIWLIKDNHYEISSLEILKRYPPEPGIRVRRDLSVRGNYLRNEPRLKERLLEILHDLEQYHRDGAIHEALNISSRIVEAITDVAGYLVPLLREALHIKINSDVGFKNSYRNWKILENSTLKILASSSRRVERVDPIMVLAKFTYYKLIGKILLYKSLSENLSGLVPTLIIDPVSPPKAQLENFFTVAKQIDYQAVFERDFTDALDFDQHIDQLIITLLNTFNEFDFRILPNELIGNILENLVPQPEKQKFGQYFTSETLALLVSLSALHTRNQFVIDPTAGTGTFLTAFYNILKHFGITDHQQLLNQIWGNDISHFPAVLSVINLYKQNISVRNNFPRVTRKDFFRLVPGQQLRYPDPVNEGELITVDLPQFDAIISNFPFIQQEDIPNKFLSDKFREEFTNNQTAFVLNGHFDINERSDYFVYCFYNSLKFLNDNGYLAAITSNAWLGKNYGLQFKKFLLDNFSIRYLFRSNAEHWFRDSKVTTIYMTIQRTIDQLATRFVTLNKKLAELFPEENKETHIIMMEDLYNEINHCDNPENINWTRDLQFTNVYHKNDGTMFVSIVDRTFLEQQIRTQENWAINFLAQDPLQIFSANLVNPFPILMDVGRGTRTGCDPMYLLKYEKIVELGIEDEFLKPLLKSSRELSAIHYEPENDYYLFSCDRPLNDLQQNFPGAYSWIPKWSLESNRLGVKFPTVFEKRQPFWYSLQPEEPANVFISINPNEKLFFSYCDSDIYLNQRLVAIRVPTDNVLLMSALLNSVVSLLIVEFNGVSRNLGVLDLNADFFKTKMKILNPGILSEESKTRIIESFQQLIERTVQNYDTEYQQPDRINFDETVLREFGYAIAFLPRLYTILIQTIRDRIEMKNR
jgi:N-6 DNA Methylase